MVPAVHGDDLGLDEGWMRRAGGGPAKAEALHAAKGVDLLQVEEALLARVALTRLHVRLAQTLRRCLAFYD